MATDYFANGVYGVRLSDAEVADLTAAADAAAARLHYCFHCDGPFVSAPDGTAYHVRDDSDEPADVPDPVQDADHPPAGPDEYDLTDEGKWTWFWSTVDGAAAVRALREKYAAPAKANVFRTGGEDEYPGRSATPPDTWLFGVGVTAMPVAVSDAFRQNATWHLWVTAG